MKENFFSSSISNRYAAKAAALAILLGIALPAFTQEINDTNISFSPAAPQAGELAALTLRGTWPENCPPNDMSWQQREDQLVLQLKIPATFAPCAQVLTPYSITLPAVRLLDSGPYKVHVTTSAGEIIATLPIVIQNAARNVSEFDLDGSWFDPENPVGGGLMLNHVRARGSERLFGTWLNHVDVLGNTSWFSLQGGSWRSASRYVGNVYQASANEKNCAAANVDCNKLAPGSLRELKKIGSFTIDVQSANRIILDFTQDTQQITRPVGLQRR